MKTAIIHPWLPEYRVPFFRELMKQTSRGSHDIQIFHGPPPSEWAKRGDALRDESFRELPTRRIAILGKYLNRKSLDDVLSGGPDLVVVEQALRNIETYELLARRVPVAFWGHGRTYTKRSSAGSRVAKEILTRRGKWFFAYTDGGAQAVQRAGFAADRVTVLQNTIDTTDLQSALMNVTPSDRLRFQETYDLRGRTALFIGGLDAPKRIPFLLDAAALAHALVPEFRLLIAGTGTDEHLVRSAEASGSYISFLGRVTGSEKALAMAATEIIAMPGRVGLVAVDSFVAGKPIVTTAWDWHAPEYEYLTDRNSMTTSNTIQSYAEGLARVLSDDQLLGMLQAGARDEAPRYTIQEMASRFLGGLDHLAGEL